MIGGSGDRESRSNGHAAGSRTIPDPSSGLVRNRSLHTRLLVLALLPPIVLTQTIWAEDGVFRESLEWLGYVAIIVCVLGRTWCTAYIAGRKKRELVDRGPYSVVRNPLYGFSFVGLVGIGLLTGSIIWAALLLGGSALYFGFVVRREEIYLLAAFPSDYRRYMERTPRWLPDRRLWRDVQEVTIRPALVKRALLDGACFLAAFPVFEVLAEGRPAGPRVTAVMRHRSVQDRGVPFVRPRRALPAA